MSTDWWSAGQRWLEQQALREADAQRRSWVKSGRSAKTFRYTPPDWHRDAIEALGRNDEETFKAIRLARLGTTGLPPLVRAQHPHAAKKSPAQLQREIDEILASPGSFSYEEAMDALEKRHAGVPRGGSLRAGGQDTHQLSLKCLPGEPAYSTHMRLQWVFSTVSRSAI